MSPSSATVDTTPALAALAAPAVTATALQRSPSDAPWLVLKFGGTSVGKFLKAITGTIVRDAMKTHRVVVVCSARSTDVKAKGTTTRLINAANSVLGSATPAPPSPSPHPSAASSSSATSSSNGTSGDNRRQPQQQKPHQQIVDDILWDHLDAARESITSPQLLEALTQDLEDDCHRLKTFLDAAEVIDEVSPRSRDIIMGTGEKLACRVVASSLQDYGVDAAMVNLERVIERHFDEKHLDQSFYDYLAVSMAKAVRCAAETDAGSGGGVKIPVVTGFFGAVPGSILKTIGRGYTDLTAALLAVGLRATELQVWKEVDGIFTADPRKVSSARLLKIITPEEAAELTYYGSEVIHPFTMEQVIRARIPIRIKNVQNPAGYGTVIFPDARSTVTGHIRSNQGTKMVGPQAAKVFASEMSMNALLNGAAGDAAAGAGLANSSTDPADSAPHSPKELFASGYHLDLSRRHPTAVTIKEDVVVLNIHSNRKSVSHGFFAHIFTVLDKYGIVVDLISTSEVHVSMALGETVLERNLEPAVQELRRIGTIDILRGMAILSLVGRQMRNMVGIAGKMFTTLAEANVNIEMISQGASEVNISCVIEQSSAVTALNAIHDKLLAVPIALTPEDLDLQDLKLAAAYDAAAISRSNTVTPSLA
ncbi:aspartate kinase [Ramicandelaber brevisporus]|nr:aspartate kinase [Ramicandelaber brevisporus]